MDLKESPILVFDSGMGGISVLREIVRLMPDEKYIYFGDSANAPYGTKDMAQVRQLTISCVTNMVKQRKIKAAAIACNTATSAAVKTLRTMYPSMPIVGVEPAVKPAVMAEDHACVLVMATPFTLKEKKFHDLEQRYLDQARIIPLPCPGLMEFVEAGILEGEKLDRFLRDLLSPYRGKGVTGIVLGCTHYPFLKKAIRKVVGPSVQIYDGGYGTAKELQRRLKKEDLLREPGPEKTGSLEFLNSSGKEELLALSKRLFTLPEF